MPVQLEFKIMEFIRLSATCPEGTLSIEVRKHVDLDSSFLALCLDTGETLRINGWCFTFEESTS